MKWVALVLAMSMSAGCSGDVPPVADEAGPSLEQAAVARGLVADSDAVPMTGLFARDADRLCLRARERGGAVIGVSIDYGQGNGCSATGTAERRGDALSVTLSDTCAFEAGYDGETVRFPGELPAGCASLCRGNASLTGMAAERLSHSAGEVAAFRDRRGQFPCATAT